MTFVSTQFGLLDIGLESSPVFRQILPPGETCAIQTDYNQDELRLRMEYPSVSGVTQPLGRSDAWVQRPERRVEIPKAQWGLSGSRVSAPEDVVVQSAFEVLTVQPGTHDTHRLVVAKDGPRYE